MTTRVEKVLESLRVEGEPRNDTPALTASSETPQKQSNLIIDAEPTILSLEGETSMPTEAISFYCPANKHTRLKVKGKVLRAKYVWFRIRDIAWTAGGGWPTYNSYCPSDQKMDNMKYKSFFVHQIVPQWGNTLWTGCHENGYGSSRNGISDVIFAVNDGRYKDNAGGFTVDILAWQ
jgi:hypothetical protein